MERDGAELTRLHVAWAPSKLYEPPAVECKSMQIVGITRVGRTAEQARAIICGLECLSLMGDLVHVAL